MQLKKFELEFSVDPLFKKASADFDEGGAKGLLLNHLTIDSRGRIEFDSSDDAGDGNAIADNAASESDVIARGNESVLDTEGSRKEQIMSAPTMSVDNEIGLLGAKFFPNLSRLDGQDICPSLRNFDLGDPTASLEVPLCKAPENWQRESNSPVKGNLGDQTGIFLEGDNIAGFEDDDGILGGLELGADAGFGEGGDAWAKNAAIAPQIYTQDLCFAEEDIGEGQDGYGAGTGAFEPHSDRYAVSLHHEIDGGRCEDILSYFDNALQKNWAGPEHWRIRRIKDLNRTAVPAPSRRKEREPFEIDFASPLNLALPEMLYTPATSNSVISLPKSQWISKTRNLLPDDKHFNSRQLLQLFLKPKAHVGSGREGCGAQRQKKVQKEVPENEIDEVFWAREENAAPQGSPDGVPQGKYDADFFQDEGLGFSSGPPDDDDDFANAREVFSAGPNDEAEPGSHETGGGIAGLGGSQEATFGTQLVTQSRRLRPEYVQYARVAKKVDVRRLKEEMWRGIGFNDVCLLVQNQSMMH